MARIVAIISLLVLTGCVIYPYPYGGYGGPYRGGGAPAATDYNPISGSRTGQ